MPTNLVEDRYPQNTPVAPLSEAAMALRWFSVADGEKDTAYIDKAGLLKGLAK
jgi:hypothetical protein